MIISYCRNFEDVILQRVFSDVDTGFYVDVGASVPIYDSNTYALYRKSWRGICIDPIIYKEAWDKARPEDILINAAVGRMPGEITFHVYDGIQQISTCLPETVEHWKKFGQEPTRIGRTVTHTLNYLLTRYRGNRSVHLLSIDVEGMEEDVLRGLNLGEFRPWVIIIEATVPGQATPNHHKWEHLIVNAGYSMAYFDGVNRFFLAHEQRSLLARFALPPNVWDDFMSIWQMDCQNRCAELEAEVERLTAELAAMRQLTT